MDRLFGLERWHAFGVSPAWVDERKAPGRTSLLRSGYGDTQRSLLSVATLEFFFLSPNLAWFAWTVAAYWAFPYDADLDLASRPRHWLLRRCAVNVCGTLLFSLFWSVSLYRLQLSRRKFSPDSLPTRALFLHNVFYTAVGALVCSAWETALLQLWATGALPHISDADVRASPALMAYCVAYALAIPLLREVHFYFSHRLLHLRALYRMCHSLHHRNTDVEPFSGLAMHPVEHLLYFSNVGLCLVLPSHPFHLSWLLWHLLVSPSASHSGWEDAWQSDQFHTIHHARSDCNYGGTTLPWDLWCGTFRAALSEASLHPRRDGRYAPAHRALFWDSSVDPKRAGDSLARASGVRPGAGARKSSQKEEEGDGGARSFVPARLDVVYGLGVAACAGAAAAGVLVPGGFFGRRPRLAAAALALGPLVLAFLLAPLKAGAAKPWTFPFHKEPALVLQPHIAVAVVCCVVPVFRTVELLVATEHDRLASS